MNNYTYKELGQLDAGSWFSKDFHKESIVSLKTLLKWIAPKQLLLNIELKNNKIDYENLELIVTQLLQKYDLINRSVISTFNSKSIQKLRQLSNGQIALLQSRWKRGLVQYAKDLGANALHIDYRLLSRPLVQQARKSNIPIRVYTINSKRRMVRCIRYGCDSIFTDTPKLCLQYLSTITHNI